MTAFNVNGPFEVPMQTLQAGRLIGRAEAKAFWASNPDVEGECGCYVFAIRAGKGFKPIYIGKATKSFGQEVFTDHKKNKYNTALASQKKGTPVLFFVSVSKTRGRLNKTALDEAETYLIQAGLSANKGLLNDRKVKTEAWHINGVVRARVGKPSQSAAALKRCLNL